DGGLTLSESGIDDAANRTALAWRLRGQVDLADLPGENLQGTLGGYYEEKQAGFSTLHETLDADRRIWGAHADVKPGKNLRLRLAYDDFADGRDQVKRQGKASLEYKLDENWTVSLGSGYTDLHSPEAVRAGKSGYDGSRLDI